MRRMQLEQEDTRPMTVPEAVVVCAAMISCVVRALPPDMQERAIAKMKEKSEKLLESDSPLSRKSGEQLRHLLSDVLDQKRR